jgi:hypothetical protein
LSAAAITTLRLRPGVPAAIRIDPVTRLLAPGGIDGMVQIAVPRTRRGR